MNYEASQNSSNPGKDTLASIEPGVANALLSKRDNLMNKIKEIETIAAKVNEEYSLKLNELQTQKKPLEDALFHIEALLQLDGHDIDRINATTANNSKSITDAAFGFLQQTRQSTHYKEIARVLQERNVYIPGKNPSATLLSRISRDSRFKRDKQRGVYALSTWRIRRVKSKSAKKHRKSVTTRQTISQ